MIEYISLAPFEQLYIRCCNSGGFSNSLKVIISNKHDFKFAEEQAAKVNANCELYLQPEWSKREKITKLIVEFVMKNPQWKISLQTHKYLNIP